MQGFSDGYATFLPKLNSFEVIAMVTYMTLNVLQGGMEALCQTGIDPL